MKSFFVPLVLAATLTVAGCGDTSDSTATDADVPVPDTVGAEPAEPQDTVSEDLGADVNDGAVDAENASVEPPADTNVEADTSLVEVDAEETADDSSAPDSQQQPDVDAALGGLQGEIDNMSDDQKAQAVDEARRAAEQAARDQGLPDEVISQIGDQAEEAARQMFELE